MLMPLRATRQPCCHSAGCCFRHAIACCSTRRCREVAAAPLFICYAPRDVEISTLFRLPPFRLCFAQLMLMSRRVDVMPSCHLSCRLPPLPSCRCIIERVFAFAAASISRHFARFFAMTPPRCYVPLVADTPLSIFHCCFERVCLLSFSPAVFHAADYFACHLPPDVFASARYLHFRRLALLSVTRYFGSPADILPHAEAHRCVAATAQRADTADAAARRRALYATARRAYAPRVVEDATNARHEVSVRRVQRAEIIAMMRCCAYAMRVYVRVYVICCCCYKRYERCRRGLLCSPEVRFA